MKIALSQLNLLVGDLEGNSKKIIAACKESSRRGAQLILTSELSLWGYPPRDLLLSPTLYEQQDKVLTEIASILKKETKSQTSLLVGIAEPINDSRIPMAFNAIALITKGEWKVIARKQLLPTYDVFDERRYFRSSSKTSTLKLNVDNRVWKIGLTICEDLWVEKELHKDQVIGSDPVAQLLEENIDLLINLSASPFSQNKDRLREDIALKASKRLQCPVIYLNQIGGNDELIFDGSSFIVNKKGEKILSLPAFQESINIWDATTSTTNLKERDIPFQEKLFHALVLGVRDYALKCGFKSAVIGLSGGIDSSLVTAIAVAALSPENVTGVLMPSPWSSKGSIEDALELAKRLRINTKTLPISPLMETFNTSLQKIFGDIPKDVTAENLQARIRGTLLMAIANQKNHLLLSTGNKSEIAVGYCTLYGDMNGGLSVIGDLYKTSVFELCGWLDIESDLHFRNLFNFPNHGDIIGSKIREKPPSAELRPGQLDNQSLPEYHLLDPILKSLIESQSNSEQLINQGYEPELIAKIKALLKNAEFKRKQAPPLLKVSHQAFGTGWRLPIASK